MEDTDTGRLTVTLPADLLETVRALAAARHREIDAEVADLIRSALRVQLRSGAISISRGREGRTTT